MRKKLIASIMFLIVCITSTLIYAAIDAKVEINPSATTVKPGDEVTFVIRVKDIVSENGANGLEGNISYDTDKFEAISNSNVSKAGSWDVAYYNGKVIAEGLTAIKDNTDVISIKLKVKDDSSLDGKTANVSLNNTVVYNTDKVDLGTVSGSVKIEAKDTEKPGDDSQNTPTPTAKPNGGDETPAPTSTAKPNGGSESTPTPSTKPGGTNSTPAPTATTKPNSGVGQGNRPLTNIDTNTSTGTGTSNNKGGTTSGSATSNNKGGTTLGSTTNGTTAPITSLPKAGIESTITILTIVAALLGTVAYIKLRNYREI